MMEEKTRERLRRAREEKERVNEMLERGIPKPKQMTQTQLYDQEQKRLKAQEEKRVRQQKEKQLESNQNI